MHNRYKLRLARITGVFILALAALAPVAQLGAAADGSGNQIYSPLVSVSNGNFPNCRLGVGSVAQGSIVNYNYKPLNIGWYIDWSVGLPAVDDLEYYPIIGVKQDTSITNTYLPSYHITPTLTLDPGGLGPIVQAHKGQTWIIGNEIDRVGPDQNATLPDMYSQVYHDAYEFIKGIDPTAKVAIGSVVEITPLRLQYLDMVLAAYRAKFGVSMPIDVWNIHLYILQEVATDWGAKIPPGINVMTGTLYTPPQSIDINVFRSQVVTMRSWMKSRGYQYTPLIITEFGALLPYWWLHGSYGISFSAMEKFNKDSIDYLSVITDTSMGYPLDGYRLVQQGALYSLNDDSTLDNGGEPDLRWGTYLFTSTNPYPLSVMGAYYRDQIASQYMHTVDLFPYSWSTSPGSIIITPGLTVSPVLNVLVGNSGNDYPMSMTTLISPVVQFVDVTSGTNDLVGIDILPPFTGCGNTSLAEVVWPNLSVGRHTMRIEVDPEGQVVESLKSNNVMTVSIVVGTYGVYLPLVMR